MRSFYPHVMWPVKLLQPTHTLERLCYAYQENSLSEELSSLLQINRDNNSSQAARRKIFKAHFPCYPAYPTCNVNLAQKR